MKNIFIAMMMLAYHGLVAQQAPVNPNATPEAKALLRFFYDIRGNYTVTGQHNFPISRDRNSQFAAQYIGKTPVIWSQDFGFAADGDKDSYLARPSIVEEAIKQHKAGSIVALCWHAVPPTAVEPITFQPLPGSDSTTLASVQGKLLDRQFRDILTPGTDLYKKWLVQVDEVAQYLKQLQDAHVPVLWRPYHEMNGDWFWWGGRYEQPYTTERLYRQIFDRLVKYHKLNNLIWMWSIDRPSNLPGREFKKYYPGNEYLDIVSLDVYGSDFNPTYYNELKALSQGKPLALGEVGVPPTLEILKSQPEWVSWVIWSGMAKGTPKDQYKSYTLDKRILFLEDSAYISNIAPLRSVSGLPPLSLRMPVDFTGVWKLNEYESQSSNAGPGGGVPSQMNIIQVANLIVIESTIPQEWTEDEIRKQAITCDGSDIKTMIFNSPRVQNATWSAAKDILTISSKVTFNFGGNTRESTGKDVWRLERKGQRLIIDQTVNGFRGTQKAVQIYDKQ